MGDRIRELEDALRDMSEEHARCPGTSFFPPQGYAHPLLREDLLRVKSSLVLYGPNHTQSVPNIRRSPSGSISDDSELEGPRYSNPQILTPQSDQSSDTRHQYFQPAQSNNTFSAITNQPIYHPGNVSVSGIANQIGEKTVDHFQSQNYDMSMSPSELSSSILSPVWDPDSVSPTSQADMHQYASSYAISSSVTPAIANPHQISGYSGNELYQGPSYQTVAQAAQLQNPYPQMHLPSAHNARPTMSDEELIRRFGPHT